MIRQERCPKEADIGEALRANAPSPMYLTRRIAIQHSKMFRFLNACILQTYKFAPQSPLKIGTFSVGGGQKRREWGPGRGGAPRSESKSVDCRWQSHINRSQIGTLAHLVEILRALPVSEGWYIGGAVRRAANSNPSLAGGKRTITNGFVKSSLLCRFLWLLSCSDTRK